MKQKLIESIDEFEIRKHFSAMAWYEFCRFGTKEHELDYHKCHMDLKQANQDLLAFIDTLFTKDQEQIMARLREIKSECKERLVGKHSNCATCSQAENGNYEICWLVPDKQPKDWEIF